MNTVARLGVWMVLAIVPTAGWGQTPDLRPGDRVRGRVRVTSQAAWQEFFSPGTEPFEGRILDIQPDALLVLRQRDTTWLPVIALERMEVHVGRSSRPWQGAAIGGTVVWLGAAASLGLASRDADVVDALWLLAVGGGAAAGYVIGDRYWYKDDWAPVSLVRLRRPVVSARELGPWRTP